MQTVFEAAGGSDGLLALAGPHEEMDRRAIACFDLALDDVGSGVAGRLRGVLHDYFAWATSGLVGGSGLEDS